MKRNSKSWKMKSETFCASVIRRLFLLLLSPSLLLQLHVVSHLACCDNAASWRLVLHLSSLFILLNIVKKEQKKICFNKLFMLIFRRMKVERNGKLRRRLHKTSNGRTVPCQIPRMCCQSRKCRLDPTAKREFLWALKTRLIRSF